MASARQPPADISRTKASVAQGGVDAKKHVKKPKARNQPTRIDWLKAEKWYMEDARRSYTDVAKQFGIGKRSVERHALTYDPGWAAVRQELGETVSASFVEQKAEQLAAENAMNLKQFKSLSTIASNILYDLNAIRDVLKEKPIAERIVETEKLASAISKASNALTAGVNGSRTILGLPILIARSETIIQDTEPVTIDEAEKSTELLLKRKNKLRAIRAAQAHRS